MIFTKPVLVFFSILIGILLIICFFCDDDDTGNPIGDMETGIKYIFCFFLLALEILMIGAIVGGGG